MGNNIDKINRYAEKGKVSKILPYLKSKNQETRIAAIRALGNCEKNEEAINNLTSMMPFVTDKAERIAVFDALGNLGKEQSFYQISHYFDKETDPEIREVMRKAMGKIRQRNE